MLTVSVERGVADIRSGGRAEHTSGFAFSVVSHDEFTALVFRRQANHQRCHHPVQLFTIAVWKKEAACFINQ